MFMLNPAAGLLLLLGSFQAEPPVNLLKLIDLEKDVVKGEWTLYPKGLVSPGQKFTRIMIPYVPPEEYDVTIVAERKGESNSLNFGLAVGDVQFLVIIDAYSSNRGYQSGLELIDGRSFRSNATNVKGEVFPDGKRTTVVCSVRKGHVTVTAGGKGLIDWKGDFKRLRLQSGWIVPRKDCLLIGSWTSVVRIEKMELTVVTGKGRTIRGEGSDALPGPAALKLQTLVGQLDSPKFEERNSAEEALRRLPLARLPEIKKLVQETGGVEARLRVDSFAIPEPWPKLLDGTISEAHDSLLKLSDPGQKGYRARESALSNLLKLSPKEATSAMETIQTDEDARVPAFLLRTLAVFPPEDPLPILAFLKEANTSALAADVLIAMGDPSVIPEALRIFPSRERPQADQAARVLERFGPGDGVDKVVKILKDPDDRRFDDVAIRILGMAPVAEATLLEILESDPAPSPKLTSERLARALKDPAARIALMKRLESDPRRSDKLIDQLAAVGGEKTLRFLRKFMGGKFENDSVFLALRDTDWALDRLEQAMKNPSYRNLNISAVSRLAAAGGAAVREDVLRRLRDPGTKVSDQKSLLPLLGAVGRREDAKLLIEKLADERLTAEAAQGLDMIGDPDAARPLMEAFKNATLSLHIRPALIALPTEPLEDDIVEMLSDPDGYMLKFRTLIQLAARRLTPRLRDVLFQGLTGPSIGRGETLQLLLGDVREEDGPRIAKLRAHEKANHRACGLLLALIGGDGGAADELATLLSGEEYVRISAGTSPREMINMNLLEWAAPAGEIWNRAVVRAWRAKPGWDVGAIWLAAEGDEGALKYVTDHIVVYADPLRQYLEMKLAAKGDPTGLAWTLERAQGRRRLTPEHEEAFVAGADPESRARVIAFARSKVRYGGGIFMQLAARLAAPEATGLYRQYLLRRENIVSRASNGGPATPLCIRALGKIKAKDATGFLRRFLRSRDSSSRAAAAFSLSQLGDRESIPYLVRLVDDPAIIRLDRSIAHYDRPLQRVWHSAMAALETLTGVKSKGKSVADRREFWRKWHADNR